jgi:hypothetical protein
MVPAAGAACTRVVAGTTLRASQRIERMDVLFSAMTVFLFALVVVGIAAIELGIDSRPGFDGSAER